MTAHRETLSRRARLVRTALFAGGFVVAFLVATATDMPAGRALAVGAAVVAFTWIAGTAAGIGLDSYYPPRGWWRHHKKESER